MSQKIKTKNEKLNGKLRQTCTLVYCPVTLLCDKRKHYSIHIEEAVNITVQTTPTGEDKVYFCCD